MRISSINSHLFLSLSSVLILIWSESTFTQELSDSSTTTVWLNGGLGFSSLGSLAGSAAFSIKFNRLMLSVRTTANSECVELFCGGDEFYDYGILVGFASATQKSHLSISAGIARVTGSRFEGDPGLFGSGKRTNINPTVGLPVELQYFAKLSRIFGLGIYFFANVNREKSFGGLTIGLQLGKLK